MSHVALLLPFYPPQAFPACRSTYLSTMDNKTFSVQVLIPVKTKPTHGSQNDLRIFVSGAGGIGVVDAQNKGSTVGSRKRPVIDSGASASYMQLSGGRGGKAYTDLLVLRQGSS